MVNMKSACMHWGAETFLEGFLGALSAVTDLKCVHQKSPMNPGITLYYITSHFYAYLDRGGRVGDRDERVH